MALRRIVAMGLLAASQLSVAGCKGDVTAPQTANIAGTWRFTYSNMTGSIQGTVFTCNFSSLDFVISQSGSTFSGIQQGTGNARCYVGNTKISDDVIGTETLVGGAINGDKVTFRLGSTPGPHTGTVNGTSMSGNAIWLFDDGVTITGQFTAARF